MAILKVRPTALKKVIKVGIVGPRTFSLGGHDTNNPVRIELRKEIIKFFHDRQKDGSTLLGITGLDVGAEQDFAIACLDSDIDYTCYISYSDCENIYDNIPDVKVLYDKLYQSAITRIVLSDGDYSPKKTLAKTRRIIHDSDWIIYVNHPLKKHECPFLQLIKELNKSVLLIQPKVKLIDA